MATISFTTEFDLGSATKQIILTDTSDWAGQGIPLADVNMCFVITAPSGTVIYNNADFDDADCDIWIANDLVSQHVIPLPLVGTDVEPGTYTIVASAYNSVLLTTSTDTNTYTFDFEAPEVEIQQTANCVNPSFVSQDITNYDVNGVTPTTIRAHKLYYPEGNVDDATFLSSAAATIQTGVFYDGTQTTTISTSLEYLFSDGLTVSTTVTGRKEFKVDCTFVCSILCCLNNYRALMLAQEGVNSVKFQEMSRTFSLAVSLVATAQFNIECGLPDNVNDLLEEAYRLTQCTADCTCSDGTPERVTGLGGLVSVSVVVSGGSPIVITPVTVGSTTTYTVTLSASFVNTVNSLVTSVAGLYNTIVAAGTNVTVTVATAADGTKTYTVNGVSTVVASANSIITVTPTGPVAGVTTYTLNSQLKVATLEMQPGQILTGFDTPIQIVAAVASTIIDVIDATVYISGGTIDYTTNTTLQIISATADAAQAQFELDCLAVAVPNNFAYKMARITASTAGATGQLVFGQAVMVGVKTGNPVAGNRVVKVTVLYREIAL